MSILSRIPDAETLLSLPLEELGMYVLQAAVEASQNNLLHVQTILTEIAGGPHAQLPAYPQQHRKEIETAVSEAWQRLENQILIVPAPGINGNNGYRVLGRRGRAIRTAEQFKAFRQSSAFPKELLHPTIAQRSWIAIMRGEFDGAVFFAFKAVEVAVREAGDYADTDVGVPLMREAFHTTNGRLTRLTDPKAEREALMHLFADAIGSYKNPHSHRNVTISDAAEAQEMVILASHLLRIVDARRQ